MGDSQINKAVYLDRDGVLNKLVFNEEKSEYEPPFKKNEFVLFPEIINSLKELIYKGFLLFLVSNQPDYAKGKTSLENLIDVHKHFNEVLLINEIKFTEYYYCYHHPDGIVPDYSIICECRKPNTYFVDISVKKYNIERKLSWFIGDRCSDIECGNKSNLKTILINRKLKSFNAGLCKPDFVAEDFINVINIILSKL